MGESVDGLACDWPAWKAPVAVPMVTVAERKCSYLPQRTTQIRAFGVEHLPSGVFHKFLLAGFRRSGRVIYQPVCRGCRECLPIRVLVQEFEPSKGQRRCWRRNQDLKTTCGRAELTEEKLELYQRYQAQWHGHSEVSQWDELEGFLYDSPVESLEYCYRDQRGKLLAVGICDIGQDWLSSVYFYFEPNESARGLGTFGALQEIASAREGRKSYYYLGYWVADCRSMRYKSAFRPNEILLPEGVWQRGVEKKQQPEQQQQQQTFYQLGRDGKRLNE